jgi:uncharacterized protein (TIGR02246 family)
MFTHPIQIVLLVWSLLPVRGAPPQAAPSDAASKQIDQALAAYTTAYNESNVAGMMALWAADADFIDHRGRVFRGRDEVTSLFRKAFASSHKYKIKVAVTSRKFITPDVAMDDGTLELTEPTGEIERGRYVTVWGKVDGKWLVKSVRDIPIEEEDEDEDKDPLGGLDWLVGDWATTGDGPKVTLSSQWKMNKRYLQQDYTVNAEAGSFSVMIWIGFDPTTRQIRSWFFDSSGGHGQGIWQPRENLWKIASLGVLPTGTTGSATNIWKKLGDGSIAWLATDREIDGQPVPDMEVKFVRVKPASN